MKTVAKIVVILSCLWCQLVWADALEDFSEQMSYFYLSPTQEKFNTLQNGADQFKDKLTATGNGADLLVAVLIAQISEAHNWPIRSTAFGPKAREIVEGKSVFARYVSNDAQVDPGKLDIWWSSFFATGEERFLEKIFQYAGLEMPKGNLERLMLIGSATWSFKANCRQHKKVLEFAKRMLSSPSIVESQRKYLNECIAFATKNEAG